MKNKLILASASPRRQELLKLITEDFIVKVSHTPEELPQGMEPDPAVKLLSRRKALAVAQQEPQAIVIGADTVVSVDGEILGKPKGQAQAAQMLRLLSGRTHQVYTGVAIVTPEEEMVFSCGTGVVFSPLSEEEIQWYISTGEPFDKAGGYGIQGFGSIFVREVQGDFFNVMGLPVNLLYHKLKPLLEKISE